MPSSIFRKIPALLVATTATLPYLVQAQTNENNAMTALVDASAQRLDLAREVALAKWDAATPVEDVARERQVIRAATTAGVEAGLTSEFVTRFFSAQIEANKIVQYALLASWQEQGKAPSHAPIDLAKTVRPQIDRIQATLISSLGKRSHFSSRSSCRAELSGAIEHHKMAHPGISQCLFSTALERALGSICDSAQ